MELEKCPNCGAVDLEPVGEARWRCKYCKAMLRRAPEPVAPHAVDVIIGGHAHIKVLPTAKIVVHAHVGRLVVDDEAEVEIAGSVVVDDPEGT